MPWSPLGEPQHHATTAGMWNRGSEYQEIATRPATRANLSSGPRDPAALHDSESIALIRSILRDELREAYKETSIVGRYPKRSKKGGVKLKGSPSGVTHNSQDNSIAKSDSDSEGDTTSISSPVPTENQAHKEEIILPASDMQTNKEQGEEENWRAKVISKEELLAQEREWELREQHRLRWERRKKPSYLDDAEALSCPYFFGGFERQNTIRKICFYISTNIILQGSFLVVILANSLYITTAPGNTDELSIRASWYFDLICSVILACEVFSGVVAFGLVQGRTTYLQNDVFHAIDAACLLGIFGEYLLKAVLGKRWPNLTTRPFRMVRIFKPAIRFKIFRDTETFMLSLQQGTPQFLATLAFLLLTNVAGNVLFMNLYGKMTRHRCVTINNTMVPACASDLSTGFGRTCNFKEESRLKVPQPGGIPVISGGYPYDNWCKIIGLEYDQDDNGKWIEPKPAGHLVTRGYHDFGASILRTSWPKDSQGIYHSCQASEWRMAMRNGESFNVTQTCRDMGNPMGGFSHFDNIWGTSVTMAHLIWPDSYSEVWWRLIQAEPELKGFTLFIFPVITVLETFLLIGMFVSVVTGTFSRIRKETTLLAATVKAKELIVDNSAYVPEDLTFFLGKDDEDDVIESSNEFAQIRITARHITAHWIWKTMIPLTIITHLI